MDLMLDAPFSDFTTSTTAVVHFRRLQHGKGIEGHCMPWDGISEPSARSGIFVNNGPRLAWLAVHTEDTSREPQNWVACPGQCD